MGKYLHKFDSEADFTSAYNGDDYLEPWVSYTETQNPHVDYNKRPGIDMGLPSGTRWAETNLGADAPEGSGTKYAWGEMETKSTYTVDNYRFYPGSGGWYYITPTKYNLADGLTELEAADDVATSTLGGGWHIPSDEQLDELNTYCTVQLTTVNGVSGLTFTSTINGNTLFFPFTGSYDGSSYADYWSRTAVNGTWSEPKDATVLNIYTDGTNITSQISNTNRINGLVIRPCIG